MEATLMNTTDVKKLILSFRHFALALAESDPRFYNVSKALTLAEKYHGDKQRKNGAPELSHQLAICSYLRTLHRSLIRPDLIFIVALLHDTYEDYPKSETEIADQFPEAYPYIKRISKIRDGAKISSDQYFGEMQDCPVCSVVKLADRMTNISTMIEVFDEAKQDHYLNDLTTHFFPMLKHAKRKFPEQDSVYENLKSVLHLQKNTILSVRDMYQSA